MSWRYSTLAHDEVWVDEYDGVEHCEECGEEIEDGQARFDDGEAICPDCWVDMFGEDN